MGYPHTRINRTDGSGQARKPRTGEMATFVNEHHTLSAQHFGLTAEFEYTPKLGELLNENSNRAYITHKLPKMADQVTILV